MDGSGRQASSGTSSAPQDASAEAGTTWTVRMSNYRAREDGPLDVRVSPVRPPAENLSYWLREMELRDRRREEESQRRVEGILRRHLWTIETPFRPPPPPSVTAPETSSTAELSPAERDQVAAVLHRVVSAVSYQASMQASPGCNLEELERHQEHIWRFENEAIQDVIKRSRLPPRRSASVPASRGLGSREKSTPWPGLTHEADNLHQYTPWVGLARSSRRAGPSRARLGSSGGSDGAESGAVGREENGGAGPVERGLQWELVGVLERMSHRELEAVAAVQVPDVHSDSMESWDPPPAPWQHAFVSYEGGVSDKSVAHLKAFNATVKRAAHAHATKQVPGQYSYPNPNLFIRQQAGGNLLHRRVTDLSRRVNEAIKWEKKNRRGLHP